MNTYHVEKEMATAKLAKSLNAQLEKTDIQLCGYSSRTIVKQGSKMVVEGTSLYINGKGPAFLLGSFKAYTFS